MSEPAKRYYKTLSDNMHLQSENARLKAEVDNLRKSADINTDKSTHELSRLKAEVERLTKAGDAMADRLMYQGYPATVPAWNAAKEGKPRA